MISPLTCQDLTPLQVIFLDHLIFIFIKIFVKKGDMTFTAILILTHTLQDKFSTMFTFSPFTCHVTPLQVIFLRTLDVRFYKDKKGDMMLPHLTKKSLLLPTAGEGNVFRSVCLSTGKRFRETPTPRQRP